MNSLLKKLKRQSVKIDVIPKGWKSAEQWASAWNMSLTRTHTLLLTGVRTGTVIRKKFRVRLGDSSRSLWCYIDSGK